MASRIGVWLLAVSCLVAVSPSSPAADANDDEYLLRAVGQAIDGPALLDFFRKQTADETTLQRARVLIDGLGSDSFRVREKASRELATFGPAILSLLRQTIRETPDLEVRRRARACAEAIQARSPTVVAEAAARLLALHRPPGTAETLLAFLPGPYDASVTEVIHDTLAAVARRNGGPAPIFFTSLASSTPARRIAAAVTLCRLGSAQYWPAVRKLLHDRDTDVRVQVALELASAGDKEAVPTLIELLAQLPVEQAGPIEELLYRLAGARSPQVLLSSAGAAMPGATGGTSTASTSKWPY